MGSAISKTLRRQQHRNNLSRFQNPEDPEDAHTNPIVIPGLIGVIAILILLAAWIAFNKGSAKPYRK